MADYSVDNVETYHLEDDGQIPNNPRFPLLIYPSAVPEGENPQSFYGARLGDHGWGGIWVNGVYGHHHYHSNAHEFLGVMSGRARLKIGGDEGVEVDVKPGDALVLPAGTGHKKLESSSDFKVMGAYPGGKSWDMNTGKPGERPDVLENIRRVPRPKADPLFGEDGPMVQIWSRA